MLQEQTLDSMTRMRLFGMAKGLASRLGDPKHGELSHGEFVGLLVQDERDWRDNARLKRLLKGATKNLKLHASDVLEPVWNPLIAPNVHRTITLKH